MEIVQVKIQEIKPYSKNAKRHDQKQIKNVAESIKQFGFVQPIVLDNNKEIVIGHCRFEAAKLLGRDSVPCYFVENLTKNQVKKLRNLDNKLNESEWDLDILSIDLEGLEFNGFDVNWEMDSGVINNESEEDTYDRKKKEFERRMKDGELSEDSEEYQEFLQKFESKKTTDDCYTPENIYETVVEFVEQEYGVEKKNFVRPFYPGGNYQKEKYDKNDIVVDNPPFSIISEICKWYSQRNIKFFLFAPSLTILSIREVQKICLGVDITYENGANVGTSFVTNLGKYEVMSCPKLYESLKNANDINLKSKKKNLPIYDYPPEVITFSQINTFSRYGQEFCLKKSEIKRISMLQSQKISGKAIFGGGYLISKKKAEEILTLEKEAEKAAEKAKNSLKWELSESEIKIIESLE